MIAIQVDAIIICPANSKALVPALAKARDAGITIINIDNHLSPEVLAEFNLTIPFIGPSNEDGAKLVADFTLKDFPQGTQVAILEDITTATNSVERRTGFEKAVQSAGLDLVTIQSASWDQTKAAQITSAIISQHPNLKVILAANDNMVLGAASAVGLANMDHDIAIAGFDNISAIHPLIEQADVVLMQLETPLESIKRTAKIAKAANVQVILNPAPTPITAIPDNILSLVSTITPNETETYLLTDVKVTDLTSAELAAQVLIDKGLETVILTLGSKGAFIKTRNFSKYVSGFKVNAVDTTAAGDVFNGAYTVAVTEGNTLEDAVRFANAPAALSVTKLGVQPSAHKRQEIDNYLLEQNQ